MSDPSDEFDAALTTALDRQAQLAPHADMADGAIREAGRIRTRRRVGATVAVLAAAAIVVPVGAKIVGDAGSTASTAAESSRSPLQGGAGVTVDLGDLPAGDPPAIPYLEQGSYVADGKTVPIRPIAGATIEDVTRFADGPVVWSRDASGATNLSTNGATSFVPRGSEASNPAVEEWHGQSLTAWSVRGVSGRGRPVVGDSIFYTDNLTNDLSFSAPTKLQVQHVMGVRHGTVVFNALDGATPVVGRVDLVHGAAAAVPTQPWPSVEALSAVDSRFTLMAGRTTDMTGAQQGCSAMLSYADASQLWRSCSWRPVDFSADSSLVYAVATPGGEVAPNQVAVLDATTGRVVQAFTTSGTFGRASFDGATAIDVVLMEDGKSAIVRCSLAGSCQLATQPLAGGSGVVSLVYPYQITANP